MSFIFAYFIWIQFVYLLDLYRAVYLAIESRWIIDWNELILIFNALYFVINSSWIYEE